MPPYQGMRLLTKMRHYLPCNVNLDSPQVSLANKLYPEPHQPHKIINYLIKYLLHMLQVHRTTSMLQHWTDKFKGWNTPLNLGMLNKHSICTTCHYPHHGWGARLLNKVHGLNSDDDTKFAKFIDKFKKSKYHALFIQEPRYKRSKQQSRQNLENACKYRNIKCLISANSEGSRGCLLYTSPSPRD